MTAEFTPKPNAHPTSDAIFMPTHAEGYPTSCYCCGRHAHGVGVGVVNRRNTDPCNLCPQCISMIEYIRSVRAFNGYERAAVTRAVEAIGPFLEGHGTDLSEWEAETAEQFVRAIWEACGDELRAVIREGEVPF